MMIDYGLSPESQFPIPLQQCFRAYKWVVNGGLGFIPDRVVLFGESAGRPNDFQALVSILIHLICTQEGILQRHAASNASKKIFSSQLA